MELASRYAVQQIMPGFALPAAAGGTLNINRYFTRNNLVITFLPGTKSPTWRLVKSFQGRIRDYAAADTQVVLVVRGSRQDALELDDALEIEFPVLVDPYAETFMRLLGPGHEHDTAILVLDRFRTLFAEWIGPPGDEPPSQDDILSWVDFIEKQCPE